MVCVSVAIWVGGRAAGSLCAAGTLGLDWTPSLLGLPSWTLLTDSSLREMLWEEDDSMALYTLIHMSSVSFCSLSNSLRMSLLLMPMTIRSLQITCRGLLGSKIWEAVHIHKISPALKRDRDHENPTILLHLLSCDPQVMWPSHCTIGKVHVTWVKCLVCFNRVSERYIHSYILYLVWKGIMCILWLCKEYFD